MKIATHRFIATPIVGIETARLVGAGSEEELQTFFHSLFPGIAFRKNKCEEVYLIDAKTFRAMEKSGIEFEVREIKR